MARRLTKSFTLDSWYSLREKLDNQALLNDNWNLAIKLLTERIEERYFEPIRILVKDAPIYGAGFTILTIECALIEFFATLEDGLLFDGVNRYPELMCYYKKSDKIYQRFLKKSYIFDGFFYSKANSPFLFNSFDFYQNVRC